MIIQHSQSDVYECECTLYICRLVSTFIDTIMIFVSTYLVNESPKFFEYIICIINYYISLYMYIIYIYIITHVFLSLCC